MTNDDIEAIVHARVEEWRNAFRIANPTIFHLQEEIYNLRHEVGNLQIENKRLANENSDLKKDAILATASSETLLQNVMTSVIEVIKNHTSTLPVDEEPETFTEGDKPLKGLTLAIYGALKALNRSAHIGEIYEYIKEHGGNCTTSGIRCTLQNSCSMSPQFGGKHDLFRQASGKGHWRLTD